MTTIEQTNGVLMLFWTDKSILFLAGKGCVLLTSGVLPTRHMRTHRDGNTPYYEHGNDNPFSLVEYKVSDPQRWMCFVPRRGMNMAECEIARVFEAAALSIEAIAFIVPRKVCSRAPAPLSRMLTVLLQSDVFQFDISPLRRPPSLLCLQPNTSAGRWHH